MAYVPSIRTKSVTYGIYDRVCAAEMNRIDGHPLRQTSSKQAPLGAFFYLIHHPGHQ